MNTLKLGSFGIDSAGGVSLPNGNPSDLVLTVLSDTSIKADWTNGATNQAGTYVLYKLHADTEWNTLTALGSLSTKTITSLTQNSNYDVKVVHYKGSKLSSYSDIVSETTFLTIAQSLFSEMVIQPETNRKKSYNTFFASAVAHGYFSKLDGLYITYCHANNNGEAYINLKNPGTFNLTAIGTVNFTADDNVTAAAGGGLDTGFNPSAAGGNFTQNSASLFVYSDSVAQLTADIGCNDGTVFAQMEYCNASNNARGTLNSVGGYGFVTSTDVGLRGVTRVLSTQQRTFVNKTVGVDVENSNGVPNANIHFCGHNNNGSHITETRPMMACGFGGGLTDAEIGYLVDDLDAFFFNGLVSAYNDYILKADIDNEVTNSVIGETTSYTPRFVANSFQCPTPMSATLNRKHFPAIHHYNGYSFLIYLAGNTHSINAIKPHKLMFTRSTDLFQTSVDIFPKVINDGGTMRAIDESIDNFFVNQCALAYAGGKLWLQVCTFDITTIPPVTGSEWTMGKTYTAYSSDYGDTWSELIEIDLDSIVSSSKPIVVGNEIWFTGYNVSKTSITEQKSWIIKYNYLTNTVVGKYQLDETWTNLSTTEPAVFEHTPGKYMAAVRVNYNMNFPAAPASNKGMVIAYSNDGIDWSDYTFYPHGSSYPNQPRIFKHKEFIYLSYNTYVALGMVNGTTSKVDWIVRSAGLTSFLKYGWYFRQYLGTPTNGISRYNPNVGSETAVEVLLNDGSIDGCVISDSAETLITASGFRLTASDASMLGEPWVALVKRNHKKADGTYTQRLLYLTEIPGDSNTSNSIAVWNDYAEVGDTIIAQWVDSANRLKTISGVAGDKVITFTAGESVSNAKIVYEIIKA